MLLLCRRYSLLPLHLLSLLATTTAGYIQYFNVYGLNERPKRSYRSRVMYKSNLIKIKPMLRAVIESSLCQKGKNIQVIAHLLVVLLIDTS